MLEAVFVSRCGVGTPLISVHFRKYPLIYSIS